MHRPEHAVAVCVQGSPVRLDQPGEGGLVPVASGLEVGSLLGGHCGQVGHVPTLPNTADGLIRSASLPGVIAVSGDGRAVGVGGRRRTSGRGGARFRRKPADATDQQFVFLLTPA
jgi:hypothetical protein